MNCFRAAGIIVLAPILSACAAADGGRGTVTSDSAGVRIVTVPQEMIGAAPMQQLGPPVLSIGGTSDADIAWVVSALPLPGDRIAFVNGVGSEVRVHRINGDLEATIGRAGEGPGEFRVPWRLFNWPGDSLLVWDVGLRRASIFAVSGELGRTFQVPNLQEGQPDVHGVLLSGHLLVSSEDRYKHRDQNAVRRDTLSLYRLNSADGSMSPAGRFAGQEQYEMEVPPVVLLEGAPFGATSYVAAHDGYALVGDTRAAQISVLDSTGAVVHILRLTLAGQPVTAEARKAFERANVDETWRPTYLAAKRRFITEAPIPSKMPGMGEVVVADDGSYWIAAYVPEHDRETVARTWWVVSREGHIRRQIQTPEGFKLLSVGRGYLVGVQSDALDVESVLVFALDE